MLCMYVHKLLQEEKKKNWLFLVVFYEAIDIINDFFGEINEYTFKIKCITTYLLANKLYYLKFH